VSTSVQTDDFDVTRETLALRESSGAIGAIVTFVGLVRDINEGNGVMSLTLEHYPGMAEKEIERIVAEARQRWSLEAVRVVHRVGELKPMDNIVFVGVASRHRGDAFKGCEFIMDYLKIRAPFWKKEVQKQTEGNLSQKWLDGKQSDQKKSEDWN